MPELCLPIRLKFLKHTLHGEDIELKWMNVSAGIPVIQITKPTKIKGVTFVSFEDAERWLTTKTVSRDWRQPERVDTLTHFQVESKGACQFVNLYYALHVLRAKVVCPEIGRELDYRRMKPAVEYSLPKQLRRRILKSPELVPQDGEHDSIATIAGFPSTFEHNAARIVAAQIFTHMLDKIDRPLECALQSPSEGFDLFMLSRVRDGGVGCLLNVDKTVHSRDKYEKQWSDLNDKQRSKFDEEFTRRYTIPEACSIPQLLSGLKDWCKYATASGESRSMSDVSLPRKHDLLESAPEWHKEGWADVLKWCRRGRFKDFMRELVDIHKKYTHGLINGEWIPIQSEDAVRRASKRAKVG